MKNHFPELTPAGRRPHTSDGHEIKRRDDLWHVEVNARGAVSILSVRVDCVYSPESIDVYLWNSDEDREPSDGRDFVPDTFNVSMYRLHRSYEKARRSAVETSLTFSANGKLLDVALGWILSTDADSNFVKHVLTTFGRISTARNFRVSFPTFPRAANGDVVLPGWFVARRDPASPRGFVVARVESIPADADGALACAPEAAIAVYNAAIWSNRT